MRVFFDFLPVILFFIVFKFYGVYSATAVLMVAVALQFIFSWFKDKKINKSLFVSLAVVLGFGSLTIYLQNEIFIKWKPTIVYLIFGFALLVAKYGFGKNIFDLFPSSTISLPPSVVDKLNLSWILFFFFAGLLNLLVVYNFSTEAWVNFKLFGLMGATLLFVIGQTIFIFFASKISKGR